jgi:hypothetical protein
VERRRLSLSCAGDLARKTPTPYKTTPTLDFSSSANWCCRGFPRGDGNWRRRSLAVAQALRARVLRIFLRGLNLAELFLPSSQSRALSWSFHSLGAYHLILPRKIKSSLAAAAGMLSMPWQCPVDLNRGFQCSVAARRTLWWRTASQLNLKQEYL